MSATPNYRDLLIECARNAGAAGFLTCDAVRRVSLNRSNISDRLKKMADQGVIGWWPDPLGNSKNRRRWWLAEHRPAKCPKPSGVRSDAGLASLSEQHAGMAWRAKKPQPTRRRDGVLVVPGWTHDGRFQLAPGERAPSVVSASESRPWAAQVLGGVR